MLGTITNHGPNKYLMVHTSSLVLRTKVNSVTNTHKIFDARLARQVTHENRG
jgi:hypothetical protein